MTLLLLWNLITDRWIAVLLIVFADRECCCMLLTQTFVFFSIQLFSKKRFCSVKTGVNWWKYLFQILLKVKMCSEKINLAPSVLMSFLFNILENIILSVDSVHWASLVVENYSVQTWLLNNYQSQLWTNIISEIAF